LSAIQKDWIDAIKKDWLLGAMVEVEGSVPDLMPLIGFERGLSASDGLLPPIIVGQDGHPSAPVH